MAVKGIKVKQSKFILILLILLLLIFFPLKNFSFYNLQVAYEGDPEAALIQFATHAEAKAAISSTEAVLNNRFIKMYWHREGPSQQTQAPASANIFAKVFA